MKSIKKVIGEHLTFAGASALARKVELYWEAKGKTVKAWTEPLTIGGLEIKETYVVRSNLKCGLPA